ncbi:MAG: MmcB family DNA repair protein [Alphaproteobacteria bacterium]|nr:MmcB family DNA repair protein [Alphaproteobacteria bacterium]
MTVSQTPRPPSEPATECPRESSALLARGVCRALEQLGYACLTEFPLANGRRADILALGRSGDLVIVEIKSSVADFRADRKWPQYQEFADRLFFAVPGGFPTPLIPQECGLIVADPFGAAFLRECPTAPLGAARRRAVTLRFGRIAAARLRRHLDPAARQFENL